ncbi:MAG: DedA family protein, partial [Steroidobacteraceae bacterium]
HYRKAIVSRSPISRYPGLVTRGEAFLRRHGGKSVFIARFTPGVRAIVPMLSGMLLMSPARFYSMNVLSAAGWGPAHILAGVAIGATFVVLGAVAGRLAVIVAILIVLIGLIVWVMRYTVRRLPSLCVFRARRASVSRQGGPRFHTMSVQCA